MSALRIHHPAITGHCSQHRMNGPSSSTSLRLPGHSDIGPSGCWKGIELLCIMSSLSTMTCSIMLMALGELCRIRRHNGRKTSTSLWTLRDRSCPNNMQKSLQRLVCFPFQHTSLIHSGSCDQLGCGTRRWIVILRTRRLILPETRQPFWRMWRTNTVPNIDECPSIHMKIFLTAISSPLQRLLDLVNRLLIHMIWPAMMRNTDRLKGG